MAITLESLIADCRIHLADAQGTSAEFFEDSDLTLYINNSLLTCWSLLPDDALRGYITVDETDLASGTAEYPLPADYYIEREIYYNGIICRKCPYSEKPIWNSHSFLVPTASQPAYYINGANVGLLPTPAAIATKGLGFYYLQVPPTLDDLADTVDIDDSYSPVITKLAAGRAVTLKRSVAEGEALIKSAIQDLKILTGKDIESEPETK